MIVTNVYEEVPEGVKSKEEFLKGLEKAKIRSQNNDIVLSEEEKENLFLTAAEMFLNYDYFDEYVSLKSYKHWYCNHYSEEPKDFMAIGLKIGKVIYSCSIKPSEIYKCENPFAVSEAILEKDPTIIRGLLRTTQIYGTRNHMLDSFVDGELSNEN